MDTTPNPTPQPPANGTLALEPCIETPDGDRVAAIVEAARHATDGAVQLHAFVASPPRLEFLGPMAALNRLRLAIERGELRSQLGVPGPSMEVIPGPPRVATAGVLSQRHLVLIVDGDATRARGAAEALTRANIDACITTRPAAALSLLRNARLPFDAAVVSHALADGRTGVDLLDGISMADRTCSIVVLDAKPTADRQREYRIRGASGYQAYPASELEMIGVVESTIVDNQSWRSCVSPSHKEEPPPCYLDPNHAAVRLQHVFHLSTVEREVALCMLLGLRDQDIAERLKKSERTAKRYVGRVLEKASIENRASLWAVVYYDRKGGVPELSRDRMPPAANDSSLAAAPVAATAARAANHMLPKRPDVIPSPLQRASWP